METARYTYDTMGRMLTVQMKNSGGTFYQTRTFVYNTAGQLTSSTTPEKGNVTYVYQADGLLYTKTEPAGTKQSPTTKTLMYYYDAQRSADEYLPREPGQSNYTLLSTATSSTTRRRTAGPIHKAAWQAPRLQRGRTSTTHRSIARMTLWAA